MKSVVDTNVAIAANGRNTHAGWGCQLACIEFLERLVSSKVRTTIVIDELGLILDEYSNHLNFKGQPGVGDLFFKYLHDHQYSGENVLAVSLTPIADETRGFQELPPNSMDKSDRKFLAAALVSGAEIVNAMDTDWHKQAAFLSSIRIVVHQLCPEHGCLGGGR